MLFFLDNLLISQESVSLQCVFHSIRFKVNKGWSKALLLFLCPYGSNSKTYFFRVSRNLVGIIFYTREVLLTSH